MNERIVQLALQANQETGNQFDLNFQPLNEFLEKFAELIVRKCADAADMAYDARCDYVGDYVGEYMGYGEEQSITTWRTAE
jgi:hypothetical protein